MCGIKRRESLRYPLARRAQYIAPLQGSLLWLSFLSTTNLVLCAVTAKSDAFLSTTGHSWDTRKNIVSFNFFNAARMPNCVILAYLCAVVKRRMICIHILSSGCAPTIFRAVVMPHSATAVGAVSYEAGCAVCRYVRSLTSSSKSFGIIFTNNLK